jgi:hypothetical protein
MAPATVLALPLLPGLFALVAMVAVHLLPVIAVIVHRRLRDNGQAIWPAGLGFMLLACVYLAGVSSLVEYGENMRFRLEIEPVIWVVSLVALRTAWQWWRSGKSGTVVIDRP